MNTDRRRNVSFATVSRFALLPQLFRRVRRDECVKDLVHVAVQELVELVDGQLDAVVGHTVFREIIGADALRAVARADLTFAVGRDGGALLFYLGLIQAASDRKSVV